MSIRILFLTGVVASVAWAQSATIFPVALRPDANLRGEIIGSGGGVGTTYALSGETRGITFTLTLAEDATRVVERVSIPTRSYDLSVDCIVSAGSATCENVVVSDGVTSTLEPTTLSFSPFAVPVSTSGVVQRTRSVTGSTSRSSARSSSTVRPTSITGTNSVPTSSASTSNSVTGASSVQSSAPSVSPSVPISITSIVSVSPSVSITVTTVPSASASASSVPAAASSLLTHQSSISAGASSTAITPTASVATLASPSASQSSTSDASTSCAKGRALVLSLIVALCIIG
ncbi:hypothetical protein ACEPAI_6746 [Sanghuangporus weigelae]